MGPEHHIGTLHGFLLRFVVYPFAHLLGATQPPAVRTGDRWPDFGYRNQHQKRLAVNQFRFSPEGDLILSSPPLWAREDPAAVCAEVADQVKAIKRRLFAQGVMSSDDAMWVALQVLTKYPNLARAVAGRFDELLIDEAQDTSQLQLACLRHIHSSGSLNSIVLIGDLEQSIYSFQGASAAGCRELATHCNLATVELTENHRSSQKLCDVAVHFCTREEPDDAVGEHSGCAIDPEVTLYPTDAPETALEMFRERLSTHSIDVTDAAVLARSETMIRQLTGDIPVAKVEPNPKLLGRFAAALAAGTLGRRDVTAVQELIAYAAFDERHLDQLDPEVVAKVQAAARKLLLGLPTLDGDLRSWIQSARPALGAAVELLTEAPAHTPAQTLRAATALENFEAAAVFAPPPEDLVPQTVHAVKGEDRGAVMVVVRKPHASDPAKQLELFESALDGLQIEAAQEEERRVTYVALTRAERYCLLALPETARGEKVAQKLAAIGFVSV